MGQSFDRKTTPQIPAHAGAAVAHQGVGHSLSDKKRVWSVGAVSFIVVALFQRGVLGPPLCVTSEGLVYGGRFG